MSLQGSDILWTRAKIHLMADIVIVGEAWDREEAAARAPFVGPRGKMLFAMLRQVGIERERCFVTNVFNLQPEPQNDVKNLCGPKALGIPGMVAVQSGKYVSAQYASELTRLYREIANEKPNLILALGGTPAWALFNTAGIKKVRGAPSYISGPALAAIGRPIKVLPTYHPAAIMREYPLRSIVIADLEKAARESLFPEIRRPQREIWIRPSLDDLHRFDQEFIREANSLSVDIETAGDQITCVGFAPSREVAIVVPFVDPLSRDGNYWQSTADELVAWNFVRRWCASTLPAAARARLNYFPHEPYRRGIGQNNLYDINRLWRGYGIPLHCEFDTMLTHHAMQPEMEKGLGFLGTIYTDELQWKFMRKKHETLKKED